MKESLVDKKTNRMITRISKYEARLNQWKPEVASAISGQISPDDLNIVFDTIEKYGYNYQISDVESFRNKVKSGDNLTFDEWNKVLKYYDNTYNYAISHGSMVVSKEENHV